MKRSEALVKLQKILVWWEDCKLDLTAADLILSKIEKDIGMEPPYREWKEQLSTCILADDNGIESRPIVQCAENSWEPEECPLVAKISETQRPE